MSQMSPRQLATGPALQSFSGLAALRGAVQDAGERGRDLAWPQRLGEQLTSRASDTTIGAHVHA